tara:strand:+ start:205 stop:735 length:531 start_codon:yes stop_codon:yes gene_type:complete
VSDGYSGIADALSNLLLRNGSVAKDYQPNFQGIIDGINDISREWSGAQPGLYPPGWATSETNGVVTGTYLYAPINGQLWFDTRHGRLMIYVEDGFYQANGADVLTRVSETTPSTAQSIEGALWYQPSTTNLYLYDGTAWINLSVTTVSALKTSLYNAVNTSSDYATLKANLLTALS